MNDPFGQAIKDYFEKGAATDILIDSNYTEGESIPVSYFFRAKNEMPELELKALQLCKGKILDVGAAAGCHTLILQDEGKEVIALEISEYAVDVMKRRGVKDTVQADIFKYDDQQFDTILLLMNGTGIGGTVNGLKKLLVHLKSLLNKNGQILIDSSDIKYLFEEEDGSVWVDLNNPGYYGEMRYEVRYKKSFLSFDWLFTSFDKLKEIAFEAGLKTELVYTGKHFDFLARLSN